MKLLDCDKTDIKSNNSGNVEACCTRMFKNLVKRKQHLGYYGMGQAIGLGVL